MKVVLYARFSPRPNADECDSCDKQLADMRAHCERKGWEIVAEFRDDALSGADDERPGLQQALRTIRRRQYLLVRSVDRLTRDLGLQEALVTQLASRGAYLVSMDGVGVPNETPHQKFLRRIIAAKDELDREITKARTSARMRQHQANGRRMSARTPYGWVTDPMHPERLIEDADEQAAIRRILELRESMTLRAICAQLHAEGITCRGGRWNHVTVMRIIARAESAALAR